MGLFKTMRFIVLMSYSTFLRLTTKWIIRRVYACYIAVGILKTAIGVTAILPTAIAEKKSIFLNTFGPFFKTIC